MQDLTQRVADRYLIRLAVRQACETPAFRTRGAALQDLTPRVVEAFVEGFYLPTHSGQIHVAGLIQKLKQLTDLFKKAPQLWEKFKSLIGIESLWDIPKAIKELAQKGYRYLRGLLEKAFETWPLKLYTLEKGKVFSVNDLLDKLIKKYPAFDRWLRTHAKAKVDQFDQWLREHLPAISTVLMAAIYIWIWFNVVEFEWDVKSLTDAMTGRIALADLLGSLPSSGIGALMNALHLGTFTLFPAAIIARLLYLIGHRYLIWDGRRFHFDSVNLEKDFGVPQAETLAGG